MDALIEKLQQYEQRYNQINDLLVSDDIISKPKEMTKLAKEQASIKQIVDAYNDLKAIDNNLQQAHIMLKENDEELKEMAKMEIEELEPKKEALLEHIQLLLIPKDPNDDHNVIMEIRGGAGGDEGNIFAGDLYRMYCKYAESKGWKIQLLEASESEAGGFSQIIFAIKGTDVYKELKFESGAHRVQRVPKTETQGRIHTSTATVLCQPEAEDEDIEIPMSDLTIETHRASGAGGQHINKTDSAVRITHLPTGIVATSQDGRSQHDNRDKAMQTLRARVYQYFQDQQTSALETERKSKVGSGDRSEKIRTYNYPQNRVTDHRIGLTIQQLDKIMDGKLDDIIQALINEDQRLKLLGEQNDN